MGYIFAIVAAVVLLFAFFRALGAGSRRGGATPPGAKHSTGMTPSQPATDTPTPGRSGSATPAQAAAADRHTPPA